MEQLKNRIEEVVLHATEGTDLFLVDIVISKGRQRPKIIILVDGDQGITIDQCSQISRQVSRVIEEEDLIEDAFILDVSSPGLDHPLTIKRQYVKNIGRQVKLILNDGHEKIGELLAVTDNDLVIKEEIKEKEKGKKAKISYEERTIPFENINKTFIVISFK